MVTERQEAGGGRTKKAGPVRTCLGCGKRAAKAELIRFAVVNGRIIVDGRCRLAGRGAYSCRQADCLRLLAKKGKKLARALRCERHDPQHDTVAFINAMIESL
jgi:hypothetical protein